MIFDRNENKPVIALLGAGSMGTAIVRRIAAGKKILLGDISEKNLEKVSHDFQYSSYDVETMIVNALEKDSVRASVALTAKVYGASGTWTLPVNAHFTRIDGQWYAHN